MLILGKYLEGGTFDQNFMKFFCVFSFEKQGM